MKKKIIIGTLSFMLLFFLFLVWFKATYSMDIIDSFEKGKIENTAKVLIASQGSDYKKSVVNGIIENEDINSIYYKVIDVSELGEVQPENWDAIIILHTWEIFKPEENANQFIKEYFDAEKMFVVSTSASGGNAIEGVDGITGASDLSIIDEDIQTIILWLVKVLNTKGE